MAAWTTRRLLQWTTEYFARKGLDSPRLSAEMLLAHVLRVPRLRLYMEADRPASEAERDAFRGLVERAVGHEPVDYLVGESPFFSLTFEVNADVLVPRPSTETLVEHVLQHARQTPGFRRPTVADLGTGSGAIAVVLAKHLPEARVLATDVSEAALAVARRNAARHGVSDRIDFRVGALFEPLAGERVSLLVSNPPYIPDTQWGDVPPNVKDHEPAVALRGGPEGLDMLRPLVEGCGGVLAKPAHVAFEHAASHAADLVALALAQPHLTHVRDLLDHERLPRVLVADRA